MVAINGAPTIEFGSATASQTSSSQWHEVAITKKFENPVVIFGPLTSNDEDPTYVRVKDITPTSFKW